MPDLLVIVPSRGRPHTVQQMAEAFRDTCTAETELLFVIDDDDPEREAYQLARAAAEDAYGDVRLAEQQAPGTMVSALNRGAQSAAYGHEPPAALGFMGDDHRPRTKGWDKAYLEALRSLPGIVYGNDLIQGERLPTQCAMSTALVRHLGFMAPPELTHLYVDNYWLAIGRDAGCISYLPNVVVEHVHPVAGKAEWDEGYRRVNAPTMYAGDRQAYSEYMAAHRARDVLAVRKAAAEAGR
ncbi:glycosyltransferase family 2 protein [Streptomyces marianii]|uniref:Glycosyltransferase n=1 Tax=Streptomyces marianii TaxID=1817406 RepID=A0A5R9E6X5_9ACTN|nr:glycosyltransferase [Streptomyces marianii]TLQ45758.1 hypothetical protein FEF34_24655 [Streptomyces marianii]